VKLNAATDKLNHAAETLRVHEEIGRNAQEHFRRQIKPDLYSDLKNREKERCEYTKNVLQEYIQMERQVLERQLNVVDALCDKINAIDILEDLECFVSNCVSLNSILTDSSSTTKKQVDRIYQCVDSLIQQEKDAY